jgi:hypothetical protein
MATLKDSPHFVPLENLPQIEGGTSFQHVYARLSQSGHGGFLLVEGGRVQMYVKAYALAQEAVQRVVQSVEHIQGLSVAEQEESLKQWMEQLSQRPIRAVLDEAIRSAPLVVVSPSPVDIQSADAPLQDHPDTVFEVQEDGESIGWYLNHEGVRDTTTQKTVYVCARGHENSDADHGTCYYCPRPITGTIQK